MCKDDADWFDIDDTDDEDSDELEDGAGDGGLSCTSSFCSSLDGLGAI